MAKPGDHVKISTSETIIEGTLMPSVHKDTVIVKLDNGYNLGVSGSKIKKIEVVKVHKEVKGKAKKVKQDQKLPKISILHTGGTIASKVDYKTGGTKPQFSPEELLAMIPEIKTIAHIKSRLVRNIWSQDMRFAHYNLIAKEIKKEIDHGAKGVIVSQGTDTIHYTAAALSFILEDLPVPVLVVGAQRSSDRGSTDAHLNLINAAYFMANTNFAEVGICMHENSDDKDCLILPGTKARKMHTSRRDAFRPINTKPWARVNYKEKKISYIKKSYKKRNDAKIKLMLFSDKIKVAIVKQHTNMFAEQFKFYEKYDGLVIEATGLGCLPISEKDEITKESGKIFKVLEGMIKKGVIVVESPQTIYGRINMNVYEDQRHAQDIGILGNLSDMTTETTFVKLAWLLSNFKKNEVKDLISKNLRGEISGKTESDTFLI